MEKYSKWILFIFTYMLNGKLFWVALWEIVMDEFINLHALEKIIQGRYIDVTSPSWISTSQIE